MRSITHSCTSLKNYYGDNKLRNLSVSWLNKYSSSFSDEKLCKLFENTFKEDASYFNIEDNIKMIAEWLMINYYHNEAFVKSSFANHLKTKECTSFFELPVNDSRVDICSVDKHSYAFEIKTKYDSLKRLTKQLNDYLSAFEYVYVICSTDKMDEVISIVPECVGVYIYDDSAVETSFSMIKEAKFSPFINPNTQISILRQSERSAISNFDSDSGKINSYFKGCLIKRNKNKWDAFCKHPKNLNRLDYQYYFSLL